MRQPRRAGGQPLLRARKTRQHAAEMPLLRKNLRPRNRGRSLSAHDELDYPDYCRLNLGRLAGIVLGAAAPDYLADGRGNGGAVFSGAVAQIPRRAASTDAWPNRGRSGGRSAPLAAQSGRRQLRRQLRNHCSVAESAQRPDGALCQPALAPKPASAFARRRQCNRGYRQPEKLRDGFVVLAQNIAQKRNNLMALACLSAKQTIVYGAVVNGCCF